MSLHTVSLFGCGNFLNEDQGVSVCRRSICGSLCRCCCRIDSAALNCNVVGNNDIRVGIVDFKSLAGTELDVGQTNCENAGCFSVNGELEGCKHGVVFALVVSGRRIAVDHQRILCEIKSVKAHGFLSAIDYSTLSKGEACRYVKSHLDGANRFNRTHDDLIGDSIASFCACCFCDYFQLDALRGRSADRYGQYQ